MRLKVCHLCNQVNYLHFSGDDGSTLDIEAFHEKAAKSVFTATTFAGTITRTP